MKPGRIGPILIFILFVIALLLFDDYIPKQDKSTSLSPQTATKIISVRQNTIVSRVVDGDTIKVLIQGKEDTVRLIGIDAPETMDPDKPIQCFGKEASNVAKKVLAGKTIILESDSTQGDRDEYGRLLRYVFLQDGTNFDEFMIDKGFAREYTFKNNPYKYHSEFIQAQLRAQEGDMGVWGACE
jgi:micrococcal nuclease